MMIVPYPPDPAPNMREWGEGPWQHEPSVVTWVDSRTGLNCAMIRNPVFGSWCGYVAVEAGHPLHGKAYDDRIAMPADMAEREIGRDVGIMATFLHVLSREEDGKIEIALALPAHGSITYAAADEEGRWWFGFDCGHAEDLAPAAAARQAGVPEFPLKQTYRDHDYVHGIVTRLAWALDALRGGETMQTRLSGLGPSWVLTTEHAASSHGDPVLVDEHTGTAYGPGDILPDGRLAFEAVEAVGDTADALARRFRDLGRKAAGRE